MGNRTDFSIVTIGWDDTLVRDLADPIAADTGFAFRHVVHPRFTEQNWPSELGGRSDIAFFRRDLSEPMPAPDRSLLASLERSDVPTIHNMILGDRVVSKLDYREALGYATFLSRRLIALLEAERPQVVIGGFDAIHGGLGLAVARHLRLPWFALHFSVLPPGMACFCDRLSPAARVNLRARDTTRMRELARASLEKFEQRAIQAPAYLAPAPPSPVDRLRRLPAHATRLVSILRGARESEYTKFTEKANSYHALSTVRFLRARSAARRAIGQVPTVTAPPDTPFAFFGLHMQPESSIDVWAPFFSNQFWVIELLSRSLPPSHDLLVKIHKSDAAKYSREQLQQLSALPGVRLVPPFADTQQFIRAADLIVAIQGTIGLEGALLGKPVVMLGDSPAVAFPSVSRIGNIWELPAMVRRKLAERAPSREEIVHAYAEYLTPFFPASLNRWYEARTAQELQDYARLFVELRDYVTTTRDQAESPASRARA